MTYKVGDEVVYPPHGSGVVEAVEQRDDQFGSYLSIRIAHSNMTLMVPEKTAGERGVRPIIKAKEADELLTSLTGEAAQLAETPQLRARANAEAERAGSARDLAETIRDYEARARAGTKLSIPERKSVDTAKRILASEIALAKKITFPEAEALVEAALVVE